MPPGHPELGHGSAATGAARSGLGRTTAALVWAGILALVASRREAVEGMSLEEIGRLGLLLSLASLVSVARFARRGINSASWFYVVTFCLFHLGMCVMFVFGGWPTEPGAVFYYALWLYEPETLTAFWLVLLGLCALTTAILAVGLVPPPNAARSPANLPPERCALIGAVLLSGAVPAFVLLVAESGVLGRSYADYLGSLGDTGVVAALCYLIAAGAVFAASPVDSGGRRTALALFAVFVVVALPMGLRTSVLTAATAAAVTYARSRPLRPRTVLLAVLACLAVIGLTREVRERGLGGLPTASVSAANPTEALREMGGSIRPVVEVVRWQAVLDEPPAGGATYLSPFRRMAARASGVEPPREVLLGSRLHDRAGPVGGSTAAEAYHNFGPAGVVVVCGLVGVATALLDRARSTPLNDVLAGLVMVPLIYAVRNNFSVVPAWLIFGGTLVLGARLLGQTTPVPSPRPAASPPVRPSEARATSPAPVGSAG